MGGWSRIAKRASHFPFWELFDQALISGARFIAMMIVAKWASHGDLGLYSTGLNLYLLGLSFQESFLTTPFTVLLPRLEASLQGKYAGNTFFFSLILSFILAALFLLGALTVGWVVLGADTAWVIGGLGLFLPFQLLREFNRRWLFLAKRSRDAAISDAAFVIIQLLCMAALARGSRLDAFSAIVSIGIASMFTSVSIFLGLRSNLQIAPSQWKEDLHRNLRVGRWFAGTNLLAVLQTNLVSLHLLRQLGSDSAGTYAACMSIAMLANPLLLAVTSALAPAASRLQVEAGPIAVKRLTLRYAAGTTLIMSMFTIAIYFFGDRLIGLAYKNDYQGNLWSLVISSIMMVGLGLSYTVSCGLRAMDSPRVDFWGAALGFVTTALVLFTREPSVYGSAIAMLSGVVATALMRWSFFLRRETRVTAEADQSR